jgi:hypothetical protein
LNILSWLAGEVLEIMEILAQVWGLVAAVRVAY